jgi:alpha-tubulin suppressor-like RCC1 family protein
MTFARALRPLLVLILAGVAVAVPSAGSSSTRALVAPAVTSTVSAVSAGDLYTCARTSAGGAKCWGNNDYGMLGDGTTTERRIPVNVSALGGGVATVAAGGGSTCALTSAGGVKCWGRNDSGQLGDGTTTERHTPVDVSGLTSGVVAVAAGGSHTCALTASSRIECWGFNSQGQLGDGTITERHTPVHVSGLTSGVIAVAAGDSHTCALTSAGGAKCWGGNGSGELGDNKACTGPCTTPVNVSRLTSGVVAVTAGGHSCALTSAGGAKCWGDNTFGQLGDGTTKERHTPMDVTGLMRSIAAISAGETHTCAVTSGGGVRCWGQNSFGQLGDNRACGSRCRTPVQVVGFGRGPCVVPKVTGKKLAAAKRAIGKAHCAVGKVTKVSSKRVKKGRVISQKPKPSTTRPAAWQVALRVSKGPAT